MSEVSDLRKEVLLRLEEAEEKALRGNIEELSVTSLVDELMDLAPGLTTMEIGRAILPTYLEFLRNHKDIVSPATVEETIRLILARDYFGLDQEDIPVKTLLTRVRAALGGTDFPNVSETQVRAMIEEKLRLRPELFEVLIDEYRNAFARIGLVRAGEGAVAEIERAAAELAALARAPRRKAAAKKKSPSPSRSPPKRKRLAKRSPKKRAKSKSKSRSPPKPCSRRRQSLCKEPCEWNKGRGCRKEGYSARPKRGTGCYRARILECDDNELCDWVTGKGCKVKK
jgi:hypothetical protein